MDNLFELIKLRDYDIELKRLKKEIEKIDSENPNLNEYTIENDSLKSEIDNLNLKLEQLNKEINRLNLILKNSYYNKEDIETKLYNGSVTDLKQLEYLDEELEKHKKEIEDIENLVILNMEELDLTVNKLDAIKIRIEELEKTIGNIINENSIKKFEINEEIENIIDNRKEVIKLLDNDLIDLYEEIRVSKIDFIVKVEGDRCSGCNVILPLSFLDNLNRNIIVRCENCNRMLYK